MFLKSGKTAQRLEASRKQLEAADRRVDTVLAEENDALDTTEAHSAWRSIMESASADAERLRRLVGKLEAESADEAKRDAAKAQAKLEAEANRAADAAASLIEKSLPELARIARDLIGAIAQGDEKVRIAQLSRDPDLPPLNRTEARIRVSGGEDRKVLSERIVSRWCYAESGDRLSEAAARKVHNSNGKTGYLHSEGTMSGYRPNVVLREFRRIEFHPSDRPRHTAPLSEAINIPGLRAGDVPGWSPLTLSHPAAVLARLEELASSQSRPRETAVEFIPLDGDRAADAAA